MMPVIRISDDVMDMLKKFAIPLEDTPDSVLRRLLKDYAEIKNQENLATFQEGPEKPRVTSPMVSTSIRFPRKNVERYARWIVAALMGLGGTARAEEITSYIEKVFGREFTSKERESISSGETRWFKNVHWARYDMARGGLLNEDAPHGVWELTEKGKIFYK
jgi:restriction system protein